DRLVRVVVGPGLRIHLEQQSGQVAAAQSGELADRALADEQLVGRVHGFGVDRVVGAVPVGGVPEGAVEGTVSGVDGAVEGVEVGRQLVRGGRLVAVHAVRLSIAADGDQADGGLSRTMQVSRAVQVRLPASSLMTISAVTALRPTCRGVATPVTVPEVAERWWVQFNSMPTAIRPSPALSAATVEPSASASTAFAPPCSSP